MLGLSAKDGSSKVGVMSAPGEPLFGLFKVDDAPNCGASEKCG
jgi:hypothetical protein